MYNSKQKIEFLNTIVNENSYKSFARVFRNIESMEEKFGKDICDMSVDEILVIMDLKTGTRHTNTENTMSLLRTYVDWCIQNGKTASENNFDKIDCNEIDKTKIYKSKYIKDKSELEEMIAVVFREGYDYNATIDMPKELCVRLCFEGLSDEEIVLLEKTDIDYENKIIKSPIYEDVIYSVSDRILELCRYCSDQEYVEYAAKSGTREERLCNNNYVLRQRIGTLRGNSEDRPINKVIIIRRVKEFSDKYTEEAEIYKNITASKLRESKMYSDIHSAKDSDQFIEESIRNGICITNPQVSPRQIGEKLRQIKRGYAVWKNTFY